MIGKKTQWTPEQIDYLQKNALTKTNRELCNELGYTEHVVRDKCYELGLKKMEMEYWTDEQVQFLIDNYKTIGDVELAEIFQEKFPKVKKWTKSHFSKKRKYLKLNRTKEDIKAIYRRNFETGRNATILKNSGSINLSDKIIAQYLSGRYKPELRPIFLQMPELLELKRRSIKLKRQCKQNSKK